MTRRLIARVHGRVQGVGFRFFAEARAGALELTGWVRNEPDGSVYVIAEGPKTHLEAFIEALENGPPGGRVDRVRSEWADASGEWSEFSIRR